MDLGILPLEERIVLDAAGALDATAAQDAAAYAPDGAARRAEEEAHGESLPDAAAASAAASVAQAQGALLENRDAAVPTQEPIETAMSICELPAESLGGLLDADGRIGLLMRRACETPTRDGESSSA
jgi:hypothetical protein